MDKIIKLDTKKSSGVTHFDDVIAVGIKYRDNGTTRINVMTSDNMSCSLALYYLEMARDALKKESGDVGEMILEKDVININQSLQDKLGFWKQRNSI